MSPVRALLLPLPLRRRLRARRQRRSRRSERIEERAVSRKHDLLSRTSRPDHPHAQPRIQRPALRGRDRRQGPDSDRSQRGTFVIAGKKSLNS